MHNEWIVNKNDPILVTGANGFVGSKVVEILAEYGFMKIRCFVRSDNNISKLEKLIHTKDAEIEIIQGNLLSRDDCRRAAENVTVIYHLAAGVEKSFSGCFLNSVVATRNLIESIINKNGFKRFVNISSIAVYNNENMKRGALLDETCEVDKKIVERYEAYTYGKAKQDELVLEYAEKYNLPYVIVRPSVVFGPGKAKITDRIGTDTFGLFLHLGLGNQIPLTYVDNCAEAIVLSGLRQGIEGQVFNIVDDDLPTSRKFLRQYKRCVGHFFSIPIPYPMWYFFNYLWEKYSSRSDGQLPPVFNRRSCSVYWKGNKYSNKKTKELLGWRPRVMMQESLKIFFNYMRDARVKK